MNMIIRVTRSTGVVAAKDIFFFRIAPGTKDDEETITLTRKEAEFLWKELGSLLEDRS